MIARIKFGYGSSDKFLELAKDPDTVERLGKILKVPEGENLQYGYMWPTEELIDMETDGPVLTELGLTFEVVSFKGTIALALPDAQANGHTTIQVQIPHVGLLAIDRVQVLEDCCTDMLQDALSKGWRILCVCPPNAARRPDYILGRTGAEE